MSGPHPFDRAVSSAQRRDGTSAAMARAHELREEMLDRPVDLPDPREQSIRRLVQLVQIFPQAEGEARRVTPARFAAEAPPQQPFSVSPDELKRLRRIVHLLTTTMGELNLWLANIGHEPVEVEP